jgi:peptide-methionine (S)-S-oxide reductase
MVEEADALPGRATPLSLPARHEALGTPLIGPFPAGLEIAQVAMGCFWGAERCFFQTSGVYTTAVGYQGGFTPNPSYEEVCSGRTGHTETVMVVFEPAKLSYEELLGVFYENHDPTQGYRQGNDVGTQYRSAIFTSSPEQAETAALVTARFGARLAEAGYGPITTELASAGPFYYAEGYHQQYLVKVPNGYCGLGGTGVSCPVGLLGSEG